MSALAILTKCPLANCLLANCPLAKCLDTAMNMVKTILTDYIRAYVCIGLVLSSCCLFQQFCLYPPDLCALIRDGLLLRPATNRFDLYARTRLTVPVPLL